MDYRQLLVQHLELVDRLVRFIARRHHLSAADTEEFAGVVRLKLLDHDFAILRKFEGRSTLGTYLAVVIERLCLDFCTAKWGKWRPSASARRLGPIAILLEQLVVRDGITFDEAVGTLQTNHGVSATRGELHTMLLQLPARGARAHGVDSQDSDIMASSAADRGVEYQHDEQVMSRVECALAAAIARLGPEDRRIVRLRFDEALPVAEIARMLGVPSKPLYRRLENIMCGLRQELLGRGIDEAVVARIVGHPALSLTGVFAARSGR